MQLVLSGNRIIAHGEDCFLCMGGTVICRETGRVFQNATVAECDNCPSDIDSVGYEYHAGIFVPVAPYGKTKDGYLMAACFECGTPRSTDISISDVRDRLNTYATILVSYPEGSVCTCEKDGVILTASDTSGSYAFNVPSAGTWTVKATDGTSTATKTVSITKRWQFEETTLKYFEAFIYVEWPTGNTCSITDGKTTITAPGTANGSYTFTVPNEGTWTATSKNDSESVSISANGEEKKLGLGAPVYTYSGTKELVTEGNNHYKIKLKSSETLKFTKLNSFLNGIDIFLVGGGAGGSSSTVGNAAGGGGGGYTRTVKGFTPVVNTAYSIVIGGGGGNGANGGTTTAFNYKASGGYTGTANDGGKGGSGGGGRSDTATSGGGKGGSYGGNGNNGDRGSGGAGQTATAGPNGETGNTYEFGDTSLTAYAGGGGGALGGAGGAGGGGAAKTSASANTGGGGGGNGGSGGSGIVIIRDRRA